MLNRFLPIAVLSCVIMVFGCTTTPIRPVASENDFATKEAKLPLKVAFACTEAFKNYAYEQVDGGDLQNWRLELGPAAADMFRYDLGAHFEKVDVLAATNYPLPTDVKAVLSPTITKVSAGFPIMFKFEMYTVNVTLSVDVCDAAGKPVYSQSYTGEGKQQGAIGQQSAGIAALPVASRRALHAAIDLAVQDLVAYVQHGTRPQTAARN